MLICLASVKDFNELNGVPYIPNNSQQSKSLRGVWAYLGFWRKQRLAEAVHVAHVHLDAGVGETQLVEAAGIVPRTDVVLSGEG